jgi:hypothetical protein
LRTQKLSEEAARILVSLWSTTDLARGHSVLGQVAAKRGDLEEAGGHFGQAMDNGGREDEPLPAGGGADGAGLGAVGGGCPSRRPVRLVGYFKLQNPPVPNHKPTTRHGLTNTHNQHNKHNTRKHP